MRIMCPAGESYSFGQASGLWRMSCDNGAGTPATVPVCANQLATSTSIHTHTLAYTCTHFDMDRRQTDQLGADRQRRMDMRRGRGAAFATAPRAEAPIARH